jgi:hypothetical protein
VLAIDISIIGFLLFNSLSLVPVPSSGYGALISFPLRSDQNSKFVE